MDQKTLDAMTRALNVATYFVADEQLQKISIGKSRQEVAENIIRTLRAFRDLQSGCMPKYDEWDALYYAVWYQPSHINMAYSVIQKIPSHVNPLLGGKGELYVRDFGCGQLAMQFALLITASETFERCGSCPTITMESSDPCRSMTDIGWKIWRTFTDEISRIKDYPDLGSVREATKHLRFDYPLTEETTLWISLLHVAYKDLASSLNKQLSIQVENSNPDLILVTCHPGAKVNAFSPSQDHYREDAHILSESDFELKGPLQGLSEFREMLYNERVSGLLSPNDEAFAKSYLTSHPSSWVTLRFEANGFIYTRNQASYGDIYDLPF